jgi:uncharacterized protein
MSVSLLASIDLMAAAARGERVADTLSLAVLPRFVEAAPASADCEFECELALSLGGDELPVVRGRIEGQWVLDCQRCLGPLAGSFGIDIDWRFAPDDEDGFELGDGTLRLADYVEDELLLALPAVPVHDHEDQCVALVKAYLAEPEQVRAADTRTPFAGLKDLLGDADG